MNRREFITAAGFAGLGSSLLSRGFAQSHSDEPGHICIATLENEWQLILGWLRTKYSLSDVAASV